MFPFRLEFLTFLLLLLLFVKTSGRAEAQELGYSGLGPINHAMAGATSALPLDGAGAMYWNPATIGALDHGDFQAGFGRVNARWYGDESLIYTALIPLTILCWSFDSNNEVEDWIRGKVDKKDDESSDDGEPTKPGFQRNYPEVRGFNLSFVLPPNGKDRWNFGFNMSELGSRKNRFELNEQGEVLGMQTYRIKTMEFTPTFSWRFGRRFFVGFSPIMSLTEHPSASLPQLPGFDRRSDREHCAFGLQLGAYYETKKGFNFGFSVRSPHWLTSPETVQWIGSDDRIVERHLRYSTEQPLRFVFGISYTGFERFKISFDVRHYNFHHLSSLYDVNSGAHKADRDLSSCAFGLQFAPNPAEVPFVFRIGYQFSDGGGVYDDYYYNLSPSISKGHSIHYGISLGIPDNRGLEFSISLSHNFGDGRINYQSVYGDESVRRNPNENVFWWSVRVKY